MSDDTLTQEQKIKLAKALGWLVESRQAYGLGERYDLMMARWDDYYDGFCDDEKPYEPAMSESEAWARLPDDPKAVMIERLKSRRDTYIMMTEETLAQAKAEYLEDVAGIEREYQEALAAIEQAQDTL